MSEFLFNGAAQCVVIATLSLAALAQAQTPSNPAPAPMPVSRLEGTDSPALPGASAAQRRPGQLPALPVTHLDDRERATDIDGPRRVTITFAQALPITDVLMLLVRGTPFSVVTDASVGGTFIGELKDLTMRQALEAVLFPLALDYALDGTVIRVFPRRPETRLFEVNYLAVRRSLQRRMIAGLGTGGYAPGVELSTTTESDMFAQVDAGVQALLSPSGRHHVNRQAGLVHVTDFSDRLDRISAYLDALHVRITRQVRLEARVFEVTLGRHSAIDWTAVAARAGAPVRTGGSAVKTAGIGVRDPDVLVKAIAEQGAIRMIAAPQTVAMNNEPTVIRATTGGVYLGGGPSAEGSERVDGRRMSVEEGVTLTVTPQIDADGVVQLSVAPTWAESTGHVRSPAGELGPAVRVSEAETVVRVQEGETVVISGLLQERTDVRGSGGVSGFFGAQERRPVRVELVVLLTPTLVLAGPVNEGAR